MATTGTLTIRKIVEQALLKIGVLASGESMSAEELFDGMDVLNAMLKRLQADGLTIWKMTTGSVAVTSDTASYAIASRPLTIETLNYKTSDGIETWMLPLTRKEYYELPQKDANGRPSQFYYHRQKEAGTLYVWPVLETAAGETLEWQGRGEIDDVSEPDVVVDVPAEWYEAVIYGLASRLADDYGRDVPKVDARAQEALLYAQGFDRESVYFQPERY